MKAQITLQKILRQRLEVFRSKNPAYSIRAFSKRLGISPGSLSLFLNGKRKISKRLADEISQRLSLDPIERAELLEQFQTVQSEKSESETAALQLTADQYEIIGDWKAFAILGLVEIPGFKNDLKWIAERLNSPLAEIERTFERLKRLGMIGTDKDGNLHRTEPRYRTTDDVVNLSLRKSHYQNLELAKASLDQNPIESRDFSWICFPMDLHKMKEAKTLIRKFQSDLYKLLSKDAVPTEVYRLCIQFFPLTKTTTQGVLP